MSTRSPRFSLMAVSVAALFLALLTACGGTPTATPSAGATSPADGLKALSHELDEALASLRTNKVEAAKGYFREFDEGWVRIEDGIRAKSRDSYLKIEAAMAEVKNTLLRPESPDAAKATAALIALDETVDAAIVSLR